MRNRTLLLTLLVVLTGGLATSSEKPGANPTVADGDAKALAKAAVPAASAKTETSSPAKPSSAAKIVVRPPIDPDEAYKANCSRCHTAPSKFSERATVTIMLHMRVRANLTEEEEDAVLQYLTR